ncbi:MAG TPA: hypothetical protein VH300_00200 [Thermoleophilaceae bacterium]|jgi:hypothetical protein|nr:hypothetical protein [Thermoleophilaceae bacterium]
MADEPAELIRRSAANHQYFFEHLDDPAWLPYLERTGFLRNPAPPVRGEGWVQYPIWHESRYLVRVAERAPEDVTRIALAFKKTDNPRVHEDALAIAARVPGPLAARLARRESAWLREWEGHLVSLPDTATAAVAHLAAKGELQAAFELARALLRIERPEPEDAAPRQRAQARMHTYQYGRVLEIVVPALAAADGVRTMKLLCELLRDVIAAYREPSGDDFTYVWRRAVESHEQNLQDSLLDVLVNAVRDQAVALDSSAVLASLGRFKAPLFKRIAIHVVRVNGSAEEAAELLLEPGLIDEIATWHEYGELLRARFGELSEEQRAAVTRLIGIGPENIDGTSADTWRLRRYSLIADALEGDALGDYERLRTEYGEPEHATFLTYTTSWSGTASPYSSNELLEMGPEEAARAIAQWEPVGDAFSGPSPEGLATELAAAVSAEPKRFAAAAVEFGTLDPSYVAAYVNGIWAAAREGKPFDWDPVLALCVRIAESEDPNGSVARHYVASLLNAGLGSSEHAPPPSASERIWQAIELLAEDPDPDDADDRSIDPLARSINSVRGEALHAAVRYALWLERGVDGESGGLPPELRALLERHLDPDVDRSPAIRSVYGQWFAQLARIDETWARANADGAFPADEERRGEFAAAFGAYIVSNRPYTVMLDVLGGAYAIAVERLAEAEELPGAAGHPAQRLGDHLMFFRFIGATSGDDDLFARYWRAAPTETRREVLTAAGWSLGQTESIEDNVAAAVRATWQWILVESRDGDPESLAGFGAWGAAESLDGAWLLEQAQAVLALGIHLEPDFVVYRATARLASEHPRAASAVIRGMAVTDAEGWSIEGSLAEVRETLAKALASDVAEGRAEAEAVAELLGARGITALRDLLA